MSKRDDERFNTEVEQILNEITTAEEAVKTGYRRLNEIMSQRHFAKAAIYTDESEPERCVHGEFRSRCPICRR